MDTTFALQIGYPVPPCHIHIPQCARTLKHPWRIHPTSMARMPLAPVELERKTLHLAPYKPQWIMQPIQRSTAALFQPARQSSISGVLIALIQVVVSLLVRSFFLTTKALFRPSVSDVGGPSFSYCFDFLSGKGSYARAYSYLNSRKKPRGCIRPRGWWPLGVAHHQESGTESLWVTCVPGRPHTASAGIAVAHPEEARRGACPCDVPAGFPTYQSMPRLV